MGQRWVEKQELEMRIIAYNDRTVRELAQTDDMAERDRAACDDRTERSDRRLSRALGVRD